MKARAIKTVAQQHPWLWLLYAAGACASFIASHFDLFKP